MTYTKREKQSRGDKYILYVSKRQRLTKSQTKREREPEILSKVKCLCVSEEEDKRAK